MIKTATHFFKQLRTGAKIPLIGLGCYNIPSSADGRAALESAVGLGYRHFDSAQYYKNEDLVGSVINDSGILRKEFFVASKVWISNAPYEKAKQSIEESLHKLDVGYIDLMITNWPGNLVYKHNDERNAEIRQETWRALEQYYESGDIKAIGVANYLPKHLEELKDCAVQPSVNQFEIHPLYQESDTVSYCYQHDIQIVAYSSLMKGDPKLMEHPELVALAQKYKRTVAQIALRWAVQSGFCVIPKSVKPERQRENLQISEFELDEGDMQRINSLNKKKKIAWNPRGVK